MLLLEHFLEKYNITSGEYKKTGFKWNELLEIGEHFGNRHETFNNVTDFISNELMKAPGVHSVRGRVKKIEHLIEKIVRKKLDEPNRIIDVKNYTSEITDLVGVRALHLLKSEWKLIHEAIVPLWELAEKPIAYYREGDDAQIKSQFEEMGCDLKPHPHNYRSVHYIIESTFYKQKYLAEIQTRTIFEEGWAEVDHIVRYPYLRTDGMYRESLAILSRLAGAADETSTFIVNLKDSLSKERSRTTTAKQINAGLVNELMGKISKLPIASKDIQSLLDLLTRIG